MDKQRKDFYIIHMTGSDSIIPLLKDKILYANKYIKKKYIKLWGKDYPTRSDNIFTNIYFCPPIFDLYGWIKLVFDPKIIYDQGSAFNVGWHTAVDKESLLINPNENNIKEINNKLKIIKQKIIDKSKQTNSAGMLLWKDYHSHELLFFGRILLEDYLVAIICEGYDDKFKNKLRGLVKQYKNDVKIIDNISELQC